MCANVCQSCMAPLEYDLDYGTNEDKSKNRDYCNVCFRDGKFTDPRYSLKKMMDEVVTHIKIVRQLDEQTARQIVENKMPTLKRWVMKEENSEIISK